ncbi:5-(carboxyamino)imidazole ribonucleotide synthase [Petrocella sp. FN5]|uniref:5-(carboxyamino)imidazole ribonucleotide synthase n=1 Tax=Petrocella sp. FN5 TaxID=3032002 RepID=UPI0023DB2A14|nr:5-(carboxyamino)imidazole ribonucleotide synthase [Petrocella sp. FN5]MDF1617054.1 5-(carboxyamino)imidazole ribonucleotide synthase [Petrocella sp. FN5]
MSELKRIGIIGGGQLGKMMILDGKRYGYYIVTLDPTKDCPSHAISDEHIIAAFDDVDAIRELANKVDVITYEFEHIHVEILKELEKEGHAIYPTPESLAIIQNKFSQKKTLLENGVPVPDFHQVKEISDIHRIGKSFGYPMMLKSCTGGYDGKGNFLIKNAEEVQTAYEQLGSGKRPLMIERFVNFDKEISVLACRGIDGDLAVYPVGENKHINSILDETAVPANLSDKATKKAMAMATEVMNIFHGVGMFCVELFVTKDEKLYVNEVAPRPHNSGHYTIEACLTSQFENHIRAIAGLPLGDVTLRTPVVMKNLLGEATGTSKVLGLSKACQVSKSKVHLYGKKEVKLHRKMGHITAIGSTVEEARAAAELAFSKIKIIKEE